LVDWPIVHSYSRKEAIEDGVLVDLTEFRGPWKNPVAITREAYLRCIALGDSAPPDQDVAGRTWDVLWMAQFPSKLIHNDRYGATWLFQLYVRNDQSPAELVTLKAILGPGDVPGDAVLTLMLPEQD
jgi:hypothetical protein